MAFYFVCLGIMHATPIIMNCQNSGKNIYSLNYAET